MRPFCRYRFLQWVSSFDWVYMALNPIKNNIEAAKPQPTTLAADQEPKTPGGFIGFCYRKICELPAETRSAFLAINRGDQTYYSYRDEWPKEYGKKILKPGDMISKAKRHYREQNKN